MAEDANMTLNCGELDFFSLLAAAAGWKKENQMSLLVFYNALLSTLGKHLGIITAVMSLSVKTNFLCWHRRKGKKKKSSRVCIQLEKEGLWKESSEGLGNGASWLLVPG